MAETKVDREAVKALADILEEKELTEIEYEGSGIRIRVARSGGLAVPTAVQHVADGLPSAQPPADPGDSPAPGKATQHITSPMVGTFYIAPNPESPPFVAVGDHVRKGQVVCIIEAMKLMNEIESDYDGVVSERLAENAEGVEFDQPLFRIAVD